MKYINIKTQAVIETACVINSVNWKPLEEVKENPKPKKQTRKPRKKGD